MHAQGLLSNAAPLSASAFSPCAVSWRPEIYCRPTVLLALLNIFAAALHERVPVLVILSAGRQSLPDLNSLRSARARACRTTSCSRRRARPAMQDQAQLQGHPHPGKGRAAGGWSSVFIELLSGNSKRPAPPGAWRSAVVALAARGARSPVAYFSVLISVS